MSNKAGMISGKFGKGNKVSRFLRHPTQRPLVDEFRGIGIAKLYQVLLAVIGDEITEYVSALMVPSVSSWAAQENCYIFV